MLIGRALRDRRDKARALGQVRRACAGPTARGSGIDARPARGEELPRATRCQRLRRRSHRHLPPGAARSRRCRSRTRSAPSPSWSRPATCAAIGLSEVGPETIRRAQAVHPVGDLQIEYSLIESRARGGRSSRRSRAGHRGDCLRRAVARAAGGLAARRRRAISARALPRFTGDNGAQNQARGERAGATGDGERREAGAAGDRLGAGPTAATSFR